MKLRSFNNFLINAARSLIMLQFKTNKTVAADISKCSFSKVKQHTLNHHLQRIKRKAIAVHGMKYRFEVVYSLCIKSKPQEPFSMLRVVKYVRQWMMKASGQSSRTYRPQHTIVIPQWRFLAKFTDKVKGGDKWYKMCSKTPQEDHLQGLDM